MKRIMTVFALSAMFLLIGGFVFAEGTQEDGRFGRGYSNEKITLTGTVDFTAAHTVLKTDKGEWELMYPRMWAEGIDVQDGEKVTVTGYEVPGPRWNGDDDEQYLQVVSAEIKGRTYELPEGYGPMGGGYGHGGMMGGYGSGRGGMMGGYGYGPGRGPQGAPQNGPQSGRGWR